MTPSSGLLIKSFPQEPKNSAGPCAASHGQRSKSNRLSSLNGHFTTQYYCPKDRCLAGGLAQALQGAPKHRATAENDASPGSPHHQHGMQRVASRCSPLDAFGAQPNASCAQLRTRHYQENGALGVKKSQLKPWLNERWCIGVITGKYLTNLEGVRDVYSLPAEADVVRLCFN